MGIAYLITKPLMQSIPIVNEILRPKDDMKKVDNDVVQMVEDSSIEFNVNEYKNNKE